MENYLKIIRNFTEEMYKEMGIFKSDVKLDPSTLVDDLEISTRLKKILKKYEIKNVETLNKLKPLVYLRMEGLGDKTLKELERFMYRFQLGVHSSEN